MLKKWIYWINYGLGSFTGLLLLAAIFLSFTNTSDILITDPTLNKRNLPNSAFAMPKSACDAIGKTFDLKFSPMTIQLPDLRNQINYNGKNGRPDALVEKTVLHFSFIGNQNPSSIMAGERLYLVYENKKASPGQSQYMFSPNNAETPLWLEATPQGTNEVTIQLRLKNDNGEIIREPSAHAQFNLTEKETVRPGTVKNWDIGKWRVDGSLLARQKARWLGPDVFLERHGGEEFKDQLGKHRIDFTEEEETYSVYVGVNDCLSWINDKWKAVQPGPESREHPLMIVKRIDDRIINFEIWDVGGKSKLTLNLLRSNEPWAHQNLKDSFKFMGARTRSQYIFEINNERMFLSPQDWLLQTKEGWIKLTTAEQIDDYVNRKLSGVMFVLEGAEQREEGQVLLGVIFNPARTEMQTIEISVQPAKTSRTNKPEGSVKAQEEDEDEEDDEDDSDDIPQAPVKPPVPTKKTTEKAKESNKK